MPEFKRVWASEDPSIREHTCADDNCTRTAERRDDPVGVFWCSYHAAVYGSSGDQSTPFIMRGTVKETRGDKGDEADKNRSVPPLTFSDLLRRDSKPDSKCQDGKNDGFASLLKKNGEPLEPSELTSQRVAKNLTAESFSWVENILPLPYPNTLKIVALHAGKTRNQTKYVEGELKRAARTMVEKPVWYGRSHKPEDKQVVGTIQWGEYEDGRLECVAVVDSEVYSLVKNGEIQKCSVESRYIYPERVDGIRVHGLLFDGLLLVPKGVEVGDAETEVNRLFETLSKGR